MTAANVDLGGWAPAIHNCPHVAESVTLPPPDATSFPSLTESRCEECEGTENWICLCCYRTLCGRYGQQHMMAHKGEHPAHCIALSPQDLSFWCYECDSYLHHLAIENIFSVYEVAHVAKFSEPVPAAVYTSLTFEYRGSRTDVNQNSGLEIITEDADMDVDEDDPFAGVEIESVFDAFDWSEINGLSPDTIRAEKRLNQLLGTVFGNALGDAYGLSTEFLNKDRVMEMYPDRAIPFPNFKRTSHSRRWKKGDWTDDTDQMILIMETLTEVDNDDTKTPEPSDVARRFGKKLLDWARQGFPELGDTGGLGMGSTTASVLSHPAYETDPVEAAKQIWIASNKYAAPNGAVMRTSITGCHKYTSEAATIADTRLFTSVTHAHPLCHASSVFIAVLISRLFRRANILGSSRHDREQMIQNVLETTLAVVEFDNPEHRDEFVKYTQIAARADPDIDLLKLDERGKIGYTLKTYACGVYSFINMLSGDTNGFQGILNEIAMAGGDADTNGAVAGAVMGADIGFENLPAQWINSMPHRQWLMKKVAAFVESGAFKSDVDENMI